jgi:hypothetical protein
MLRRDAFKDAVSFISNLIGSALWYCSKMIGARRSQGEPGESRKRYFSLFSFWLFLDPPGLGQARWDKDQFKLHCKAVFGAQKEPGESRQGGARRMRRRRKSPGGARSLFLEGPEAHFGSFWSPGGSRNPGESRKGYSSSFWLPLGPLGSHPWLLLPAGSSWLVLAALGFPKGLGIQEQPGGARRSQREPGGARKSQKKPGRRSQEEPGGARESQEQPGGARRSHGGAMGEPGRARKSQGAAKMENRGTNQLASGPWPLAPGTSHAR